MSVIVGKNHQSRASKELVVFLSLFFAGLVILPLSVYFVGRALFGEYGGTGFSDFYRVLLSELRSGEPAIWFLILSPYLAWQLLRLTVVGFRKAGKSKQ